MVYFFFLTGNIQETEDDRITVILDNGEKQFVKSEMRLFLYSIQTILNSTIEKDYTTIIETVKRAGGKSRNSAPGSMLKKLPIDFKKLGFETHAKFDKIALAAQRKAPTQEILSLTNETLMTCTTCHATYRFSYKAGN